MGNSRKKEKNTMKNKQHNTENTLGLDPDEQAMNGAYGMAEAEEEDLANDSNRN